MATQDINSLGLHGKAKKAAEELLKQFPHIVFTSGKRTLAGQAQAMAGNVVKKRDYIQKTYKPSEASKACQQWVDDNPEAKTKAAIAAGLLKTLQGLGEKKAGHISKHLSGDAFDVQPVTKDGAAIKQAMKKLAGKGFLEKEAGLVIWHAQF
jgi:hypothetical protein